ncbi:hypothetical protein [Natrinema sp. 74]|uniref:hypothetical protein n=1 Tax=Natrinema sp. 74 TaxID=3384159 RepID=UPI0038D4D818
MNSPEDEEELTYEGIHEVSDHNLDLLFEEVHRKVESQVELNNRIEDHARSRVKIIFILCGILISSLSLVTSVIASNNVGVWRIIANMGNQTYYTLMEVSFIGGNLALILMGVLFILLFAYIGAAFGQLFVISLYCNLSAARTALVSSSASTGRLQDSIHDGSNMKEPKKCILYDYADTIAMNNMILEEKWRDKKEGDQYMIRAFTNIFALFIVFYFVFILRHSVTILGALSISVLYLSYRAAVVFGYFEHTSAGDVIKNIADNYMRLRHQR